MSDPQAVGFRPLICADLELSDPVAPPEIPEGAGLALVVRLHGDPLGELLIEPSDVASGPSGWALAAVAALQDRIVWHLGIDRPGEQLPAQADELLALVASVDDCARIARPSQPAPKAAIAVCTIGKHHLLPDCIRSLLQQDYPGNYTLLLIDNAPATGATQAVAAQFDDPRLKVVAQPLPGLSFARNKAIAAASEIGAQFLLFTDDDVIADPRWLPSIIATYQENDQISSVTGLIVPGSLASAAEQLFEEGSGFNKGYRRTVWSMAPIGDPVWALGPRGDGGPLFPFAAGSFGSGNSCSFRLSALKQLDGFDVALGAGTLSAGGEDLDVFVRAILAGQTIVYEPRAMVRHYHRETYADLRKQMTGYGSGLSAFLFRELLYAPTARKALIKAVPGGVRRMFDSSSEKNETRTVDYPKELVKVERIGFLKGPWLYVRSRGRAKRLAASGTH